MLVFVGAKISSGLLLNIYNDFSALIVPLLQLHVMETYDVRSIFKALNLTENQANIVGEKLKKQTVSKGQTILNAGQSTLYKYYVYSGCLRTYFLDDEGKEHTIQFAVKDWWISDYTAFYSGKKSILHIECIQNAEIYKLSKENLEKLYLEVPLVERYFRIKMESFFASFQRRIISELAMSGTEKYLAFLKTYPQIEKNIKNYHLASYLGITTESLSRIRNDVLKSNKLA